MTRTRTGASSEQQLAKQIRLEDRRPYSRSARHLDQQGRQQHLVLRCGRHVRRDRRWRRRRPVLIVNYEYFHEAASFGNGVIDYYIVAIEDPRQAAQVAQADRRAVRELRQRDAHPDRVRNSAQTQLKQIGDISFIVNAIVGAVLFTLLFLTGNTMMQSVRERIPELAVLKTLGFSDGKVVGAGAGRGAAAVRVRGVRRDWRWPALIFPVMGPIVGGQIRCRPS